MPWPNPAQTRWQGGPDRCIVENGLALDIHRLAKPCQNYSVTMNGIWQWRCGTERISSMNYSVERHGPELMTLKLTFVLNGETTEQEITLHGKKCHFGGMRWFARCPHTLNAVAKVYLPKGGKMRDTNRAGIAQTQPLIATFRFCRPDVRAKA